MDVALEVKLLVPEVKINILLNITFGSEMMKKRKRSKTNKQAFILLSIVGIVVIITVAALYRSQESQPKPSTEEYFEISDTTHFGFNEANGSELILHILTFNLTAVGGPARNVIVHNLGVNEDFPWEPYIELGTMLQGEVKAVQLSTERGVYISLEEEGFPVRIRITSEETSREPQEQFITIYL